MDVTAQIERTINNLGGSGSSRQDYLSSNRTLSLTGTSNSIANAQTTRVTTAPAFLSFKDTVGLFGAENSFVRVDLEIQNANPALINSETVINGYTNLWIFQETGIDNDYSAAIADFRADTETENTFRPSVFTNELGDQDNRVLVSIDIKNLKTGNQYLDNWFDVRAYDRNGMPLEDLFYSDYRNHFYLGFHARNTRRIPFNVEVEIGRIVLASQQLPAADYRLILPQ